MLILVLKRILLGLITLFIVSLITFVGVEVLPGDACTTYLEREAYGAALEACYKRLGLDIPAYERYVSWAIGVIQGDLGYSLSCLLYTSPSPRDGLLSRMPSSA